MKYLKELMNWNNGIFVNRKECNGNCKGSTFLEASPLPPTFCHHQFTCLICFTSVFPSHLSYSQSHHMPHLLLQVTLLFNLSSFSFLWMSFSVQLLSTSLISFYFSCHFLPFHISSSPVHLSFCHFPLALFHGFPPTAHHHI